MPLEDEIQVLEPQRLKALEQYQIMDTPEEVEFDEIAALASQICSTPISLISLVDDHRQWFKAHYGMDMRQTPRDISFCAHAIRQEDIFEVTDATTDERFRDNPLVVGESGVRYYAGIPLSTPDGYKLGTLCVIDHAPNHLDEKQRFALQVLGRQVMKQLVLRLHAMETERLHAIVEAKNKALEFLQQDAQSSLNYAANIQRTMLPTEEDLQESFASHFLLFRPLNTVSGDFYWLRRIDHISILAVGDCTGHGVPGAMLSMIGSGLLHQIVEEDRILRPRMILHAMRAALRLNLAPQDGELKDGMDLSILTYDHNARRLEFSGAMHRMYIARDYDLKEVKGNRLSIGGTSAGSTTEFTNYSYTVQPGTRAYLFTDGFADQFGGDKEKKIGYAQLKEWVMESRNQDLPQQHAYLANKLDSWQGERTQIDDITLLGVEFD